MLVEENGKISCMAYVWMIEGRGGVISDPKRIRFFELNNRKCISRKMCNIFS